MKEVADHTYLFNGAGEAGVGIADLISSAIVKERGCTLEEARMQIWLTDSQVCMYTCICICSKRFAVWTNYLQH